ncbi:glycosyltransferase BC10-like [Brassica napus]|uniref:glycosyltransferase BC10-like n=1 Tax=Brassica napus TaxID=3708 RepID=UPI00207A9B04|nr:glycosyltransferase BC10-like [Brassica napus]
MANDLGDLLDLCNLVSLFYHSILLICTHMMSPRHSKTSSSSWLPIHVRKLIDAEVAARAVVRHIVKTPPFITSNSKLAFLFLTPGTLPFEKLWDKFFTFSIYIHPTNERPVHISSHFFYREINSDEVIEGRISVVDAEKRLLVSALEDPHNQHFVLLSERYLLYSNVSFIESFVDPGPHGTGRHMEHMLPEIAREDFRKGAQPGIEAYKDCIADEHYLPTFFSMIDPMGISNWSVTYVDWSERRWYPKTYTANEISLDFMKNVTTEEMSIHGTSVGEHGDELHWPCTWNGITRPCYLFARKFHPDALDTLLNLFPNYTSTVL